MKPQHRWLLCASILVSALAWLKLEPLCAPVSPPGGRQASSAPAASQTPAGVIKAESNLVLVDVVVTDKKGNYVRDLEAKDFHVYEDAKEQTITSFAHGNEAAAPQGPAAKHYLVLFFDNSTMELSDQARARQAAGQFIEKTASPDRLMAIADFGGSLHLAQNFTSNTDRLKQVVANVKFSNVEPNAMAQTTEVASLSPGDVAMLASVSDFGARTMLLAIRSLCKNLASVPGRKTLVVFSGGFALTPELTSELTATVDAANKANVAIYPMDVRGLMTTVPGGPISVPTGVGPQAWSPKAEEPLFPHQGALEASLLVLLEPQRPGGGGGPPSGGGGAPGGGGGGRPGGGGPTGGTGGSGTSSGGAGGAGRGGTSGGTGGSGAKGGTAGGTGASGGKGGTSGTAGTGARGGGGGGAFNNPNRFVSPLNQPRQIIPPFPTSATTNQEVLYALANGTGGFPIFNSNDFLAGLDKIAREQNEYYVVGYVPPNKAAEGGCHTIKVKLEPKGLNVRARSGYCDVPSRDMLAGKTEGKTLEARAAASQPGNIPMSLSAPYFYSGPNIARVNLVLDVPAEQLDFGKDKHDYHSEVNVLGIAYHEDGSVAARFSDSRKIDLDKKEMKEFTKGSFNYANAFEIAPGKYNLKVVLASGDQNFGKFELPLAVEPYDGKRFQLSSVALSNNMRAVSELAEGLDTALLEGRTPLVTKTSNGQGVEVVPSANNRFKKDEKVGLYVEVYEPGMTAAMPPRVGILYTIVDRKTNQSVDESNTILVNAYGQNGNPVIPVGVLVSTEKLQAGQYRIEVRARDDRGNASAVRAADFELN